MPTDWIEEIATSPVIGVRIALALLLAVVAFQSRRRCLWFLVAAWIAGALSFLGLLGARESSWGLPCFATGQWIHALLLFLGALSLAGYRWPRGMGAGAIGLTVGAAIFQWVSRDSLLEGASVVAPAGAALGAGLALWTRRERPWVGMRLATDAFVGLGWLYVLGSLLLMRFRSDETMLSLLQVGSWVVPAGEILAVGGLLVAEIEIARKDATRAETRQREVDRRLHEVVTIDPLTTFSNRVVFRDLVDRVRAGESPTQGVILVFDMDGLKQINDTRGHSAGDKALRRLALAIGSQLREGDLPIRWGGDEFVVVLPALSFREGQHARDRIATAVRKERIAASVGLAPYDAAHDIVQALREADARMYAAKRKRHAPHRPPILQLALPLCEEPALTPAAVLTHK